MRTVQAYISNKQLGFSFHPLFARLQRNAPLREVLPFIPNLSFWVMAFQDILRLNEACVRDPVLRKIARHHRAEDSGHDKWFLNDILKIEGQNADLRTLFGSVHTITRDSTYALVSEVFRTSSDIEHVVLLLALESTGHIFFDAIASYFERMGVTQSLQYFSRHHIDVEKSHEVFEQQMHDFLASIELSPQAQASACALVDRVYVAFTAMFDNLEAICARASAKSLASEAFAQRLLSHEAQARVA